MDTEELTREVVRLRNELRLFQEEQRLSDSQIAKWGVHGANDMFSGRGYQRFGAGDMQLDHNGIQLATKDAPFEDNNPSVWFVEDTVVMPIDELFYGRITGQVDKDDKANSYVLARGIRTSDSEPMSSTLNVTVQTAGTILTIGGRLEDSQDLLGSFILQRNTTTGARSFEISEVPLLLTPDTDFTVLSDGMLWYNAIADKIRARINGVTENLATESFGTISYLPIANVLGAYKDADQEVTDTTLTNDSELTVTLAATSKYHFTAHLFTLNDGAAEGFKVALDGTVGIADVKAQISIYDDTLNTLVGFARVTAINSSVGAGLSTGSNFAIIQGTIETTTAGTFLLEWAQNAAGANAGVHMEIGSTLSVIKVE